MIQQTSTTLACAAVALALSACAARQAERNVAQNWKDVPVEAVETSQAAREAQRAAGQPVMLIEGRPAPVYRDYISVEKLLKAGAPLPQESPDVQGCVVLSYDIGPDGKTDGFEIEQAEPAGVFEKPALRAALATQYEASAQTWPRQRRALWFLIARPPRSEISRVNEMVEADRNRQREAQRAACEGRVQ